MGRFLHCISCGKSAKGMWPCSCPTRIAQTDLQALVGTTILETFFMSDQETFGTSSLVIKAQKQDGSIVYFQIFTEAPKGGEGGTGQPLVYKPSEHEFVMWHNDREEEKKQEAKDVEDIQRREEEIQEQERTDQEIQEEENFDLKVLKETFIDQYRMCHHCGTDLDDEANCSNLWCKYRPNQDQLCHNCEWDSEDESECLEPWCPNNKKQDIRNQNNKDHQENSTPNKKSETATVGLCQNCGERNQIFISKICSKCFELAYRDGQRTFVV